MSVLTPTQALEAEREPPPAAAGAGAPPDAQRRRRRGARARGRSVHHHARPAATKKRRARARYGDEVRTVIAGYHWFTDWGRDTMISLEGLTLVTGRHVEAGYILRTFAHYVRDGLIPEHVPRRREGRALPHRRRDAVVLPRDRSATSTARTIALTLSLLLPDAEARSSTATCAARASASASIRARRPADAGRAEGYQLTWMDAKVDDWVVTPRRGKAVEINALWYNALKLMEQWAAEHGDPAPPSTASWPSASRAVVQRALLVSEAAAICTMSSTATAARERPMRSAGRTRCSRSRCRTRARPRALGAGAATSSAIGC